jgi:diadenosine tetraphosphate (Ap4A) HIT family hydrolase
MRNVIDCHRIEVIIDGVKVSHFHAHLIPRYLDDDLPEFKTIKYDSDEEKKVIALKLKNSQ